MLVLGLSACSRQDEAQTAGQKLDSVIAKTEQSAAQAKAKTEETFAGASVALKDATEQAEASLKQAAGKAGEKMDDMAITAAVSSGLAKEPELSALKINVDTKEGVVTLNGTAPTAAARERAGSIAKAVKNVQAVENLLLVKPG
ncbi:MAG: BON domain-containing protein [Pseudomonadota bacterium]|nr:BON domain-containing protein [Pseudomonadota bacterium]